MKCMFFDVSVNVHTHIYGASLHPSEQDNI